MRSTWLLVLILLAACGGGGDDSFDTIDQLADAAGCTSFERMDPPVLFTEESGHCDTDAGRVQLLLYSSADAAESAAEIGTEIGSTGVRALGNGFIVRGSDRAAVEAVAGMTYIEPGAIRGRKINDESAPPSR